MAEGIVRVRSSLTKEFMPDVALVSITIQGENAEKDACTTEFNQRYDTTVKALAAAGVAEEKVKTESFTINVRQRSLYLPYDNGGGYYYSKSVPDGYNYYASLEVKVAAQAEAVAKIWSALSDCGEGITFSVDYDIDDEDAAKTSLMADAVREAIAKANALAAGAGKTVGEVRAISFGTDLGEYERPREYGIAMAKSMRAMGYDNSAAPTINPEPIELSCEVTVECLLA